MRELPDGVLGVIPEEAMEQMPQELKDMLDAAGNHVMAMHAQSRLVEAGIEIRVTIPGFKAIVLIDRDVIEQGKVTEMNCFVEALPTAIKQTLLHMMEHIDHEEK